MRSLDPIYAVHKLIVATRRRETGGPKAHKDLQQAETLIEALLQAHMESDLAEAYAEAFDRGMHWREAVLEGLQRTALASAPEFRDGLTRGLRRIDHDPAAYLPDR